MHTLPRFPNLSNYFYLYFLSKYLVIFGAGQWRTLPPEQPGNAVNAHKR
ncbi:MAG: hypothetical protein ACPHY6_07395 [Candidatus Puniceispirillaceae bacterium]